MNQDLPAGYHRAAAQWLEPPDDDQEVQGDEWADSYYLYERMRDEEIERCVRQMTPEEDPQDLADIGDGEE
jgi:hypothetical protein